MQLSRVLVTLHSGASAHYFLMHRASKCRRVCSTWVDGFISRCTCSVHMCTLGASVYTATMTCTRKHPPTTLTSHSQLSTMGGSVAPLHPSTMPHRCPRNQTPCPVEQTDPKLPKSPLLPWLPPSSLSLFPVNGSCWVRLPTITNPIERSRGRSPSASAADRDK